MSDEHKTDDGHGTDAAHAPHDDGHHDTAHTVADDAHPVAAAADDHGDHGHDDHGHAPVEAADHSHADAAGHDDHGHEAAAPADLGHDDHAAPREHAPADAAHHGHDAPAAHDDHAAEAVPAAPAEPVHHEPVHSEPVAHHDETPAHSLTDAAPLAAAAAGVAAASAKPPVWSDHGDAPFEESEPAPAATAPKKARKTSGGGNEFVEIMKTIVFALLIALVLRVFLFQPFTIPSASMEPNLYEGDYIVVSKWSYGYSKYSSGLPINLPIGEGRVFGRAPNRGDIVVFKLPRDNKTDYIKRVIGLPGDKIQMVDNKLYINGTPVKDVLVSNTEVADAWGARAATEARETLPNGKSFMTQDFGPGGDLDDTPVYEVPTGYYFMMGDNRDNSIDSRVEQSAGVGFVPAENLVGKAQIIMFSWKPGASLWNPISWFSKIRPSRFFHILD